MLILSKAVIFILLKYSLAANFEVTIDEEAFYVEPGEETYLECECFNCPKIKVIWFWTPCKVEPNRLSCSGTVELKNDRFYWIETLTLHENAGVLIQSQISFTPSRPGVIECFATDGEGNSTAKADIIISDLGPSKVLTIQEYEDYEIPTIEDKVILSCGAVNYYFADVNWYRNGEIIETGEKYLVNYTKSDYSHKKSLIANNSTSYKSGEYECRGTFYNQTVEKLATKLYFRDSPYVKIDKTYYITEPGKEVTIAASSYGYQKYENKWFWNPCEAKPVTETCEETLELKNDENSTTNISTLQLTLAEERVTLMFTPNQPGVVKFTATSSVENDTDETSVFLTDLGTHETYLFQGIQEKGIIATGETIILTCGALVSIFSNVSWYQNGSLVENGSVCKIDSIESEFSQKKDLIIENATRSEAGEYECRLTYRNDGDTTTNFKTKVIVEDPISPNITYSNMNGEKLLKRLGQNLSFECKFDGLPLPTISWHKDGVLLAGENDTELLIDYIRPNDAGEYMCSVSNRIGTKTRRTTLIITDLPGLGPGAIVGSVIACGLFISIIIFLAVCFLREKKYHKELNELKADELANFEEGAIDSINPALSLDEQALLLPYNRRFEFPREKLKLGEQIGAGAFGVVLRGVAEGIFESVKKTTVAVKMISKMDDNITIKSLVSELKIMVHLGKHLNLVNLLGAVTKEIAKRELMIIVEYCEFGNVQNFLQKHRVDFIDQINWETDQIDHYIGTLNAIPQDIFKNQSPGLTYVEMPNTQSDYTTNNANAIQVVSSDYITENAFEFLPQNNIGDVTETQLPGVLPQNNITKSNDAYVNTSQCGSEVDKSQIQVTTTNLVSWAFQVARGMDYLATRKVLHGDLAARNILLCHDNVVKICDFGLARSMYKTYIYKKEGDSLLPFKWLALESISDLVFSTKSDVWAFGIMLWEFFSLARTPYPGMNADQELFFKLRDGYRLERPEYANEAIYDIMLECWHETPDERPTFKDLETKFSRILGEDITNHYLDLNKPYMVSNRKYIQSGELHILPLISTPEGATNGNPFHGQLAVNGYADMQPIRPSVSPVVERNAFQNSSMNNKQFEMGIMRSTSNSSSEIEGGVDNPAFSHYMKE